ncbi:WYL domain-containing protein [Shewanella sp. AS16]|uniref:WYL domain-containing protein n=1 Tax=Shewanella sp. AS16 TaxID=2907625 RepID=UPI001F2FE304|nr:WYL domain-containing protein [Shewanella sp. AS16]MCE9686507.1 WYL domain-containing protein [Shewanella sp. AS16]
MAKDNLSQRLLFIELLAWWEGAVSNKQLMTQFGVSRQQAYQDLKTYAERYPHNLVRSNAGFAPTASFIPYFISTDVNHYLHWFAGGQLYIDNPATPAGVSELRLPPRTVSAEVIRALVQGIRQQKRVEVDYVSLSNPENDGRIFHPHTFVNTGLRWHVRGYCEKSQGYRDLVLSRFRGAADVLDDSPHGMVGDSAWQTRITLILQPDPRLSAAKQAVLANDYRMEGGQLVLNTRAALANYLLHELQVNTKMLDGTPEAQQLVLVNRDDIKQWLFSG